MGKIKLLYLIDDDDIFQMLTHEIIKSTEMVGRVKTFSNGADAICYLNSIQNETEKLPDVIFLDLFMPVMDGWGFIEEFIRLKPQLNKKITIYILSSSIDPVDIQRARSISEITDYLVKPVTKDKFVNTLKELV